MKINLDRLPPSVFLQKQNIFQAKGDSEKTIQQRASNAVKNFFKSHPFALETACNPSTGLGVILLADMLLAKVSDYNIYPGCHMFRDSFNKTNYLYDFTFVVAFTVLGVWARNYKESLEKAELDTGKIE